MGLDWCSQTDEIELILVFGRDTHFRIMCLRDCDLQLAVTASRVSASFCFDFDADNITNVARARANSLRPNNGLI